MAVQIILKNSSIEDKRPSASQLTNGEISLNYNEGGAFLCCRDTAGNVQQVGGIKVDEDAPDAPVKQTLWFKPSTLTLSVFDGDKWLPIAGGGGGGGGGGGDIIQIIGNDGIDADTISGIVTLDVELAGGDDGLEFKSSKLSASLASATTLGSVKVGDNIDVTDGKISVAKADTSTFGVVRVGDGLAIAGDGSLVANVPTTTTYRGSCDLNDAPTGQLNPNPAEKGDAYINSAETAAIDSGWTPLSGTAKIGDLVIFDGTSWDLIPLGAGTAPVTSVNSKTGDVVLDYDDVGAASAAQGDLADTALQPGDDISELNNDAGYITVSESSVTSVNGQTGEVVLDASDVGALASVDLGYTPDAAKGTITNTGGTNAEIPFATSAAAGLITDAATPGTGTVQYARQVTNAGVASWEEIDESSSVTVGETAPVGPEVGDLWWDSSNDSGRLYVWYVDGDSGQWVETSPAAPTPPDVTTYWDKTGNNLEPKEVTDNVVIGDGNITLGQDGSATFANNNVAIRGSDGRILTGTYSSSPGSTTTAGLLLAPGGTIQAQQVATSTDTSSVFVARRGENVTAQITIDGTTRIGGVIPDSPNITLNASGTINCAQVVAASTGKGGLLVANETDEDGTANILCQTNSATRARLSGIAGATTDTGLLRLGVRAGAGDNVKDTFEIANTGTVRIGSDFSVDSSSATITLNAADGSAQFANNLWRVNSAGGVNQSSRLLLNIKTGGVDNEDAIVLSAKTGSSRYGTWYANGDLVIGGTISGNGAATDNANITLNANGQIFSRTIGGSEFKRETTTGSQSIFALRSDVGGSNSLKVDFHADGTAFKPSGGSWSAISDARMKSNIADYTAGLAEIKQLQPKIYDFYGDEQQQIGFVAQEVEGVMPEMVSQTTGTLPSGAEINDLRAVNITAVHYATVNAIKEMATYIEALELRLAALEGDA